MENPTLVELVPDRNLLDPNFEGYKLSLDPIPMYVGNPQSKVDRVLRSEEQYSLQHVKLFGLQNHLFYDPWNLNDIYFIDEKWMVQRNVLNPETGRLTGLRKVWEIPSNHERRPGHYNPSLGFPSMDLVIFSDGAGTLHLVKSAGRQDCVTSDVKQWQVLLSEEVCGPEVPFVLVHALIEGEEKSNSGGDVSARKVHCLLLHVEEAKNVKGQRSLPSSTGRNGSNAPHTTNFVTVIEWVTLHEGKDGSWCVGRIRQLCGSAIPDYCIIEDGGTGVVVSSEHPFIFISDTEKPLSSDDEEMQSGAGDATEEDSGITWKQDLEEITISFPFESEEGSSKLNEVSVSVADGRKLCIKYKTKTMMEGVTMNIVNHDLTTWEIHENKLMVCLRKAEEGQMWTNLLSEGGPKCREEINPNLAEEIHSRLSHLTSETVNPPVGSVPIFNSEELEECDEGPSSAASLCRFDGETHVTSHKASISSNQWLFNVQMSSDNPLALCLRHGPDGLLWQPTISNNGGVSEVSSETPKEWRCSHIASFVSFGYVQASKQRKKFIACSPDTSYVAVCEASQYIYVYRQPAELAGNTELRNRRTGVLVKRVARQHLISLPSSQEILGVHASLTTLYLLMEDKLLAFSINQ